MESTQKSFTSSATEQVYNPVKIAQELVLEYQLESHFGGPEGLETTCRTLTFLDIGDGTDGAGYGPVTTENGVFVAKHSPQDLTECFRVIGIENWMQGLRPSLPNLIAGILENMNINPSNFEDDINLTNEEKALTRAVLLTALRAEYIKGQPRDTYDWQGANPYHNAGHISHVTTMSYYLMDVTINNPDVRLHHFDVRSFNRADKLRVVLKALSHDTDHPGLGNPEGDRVYNENHSVDVNLPIIQAVGITDEQFLTKYRACILATSPNSMIIALKNALEEIGKENPDLDAFKRMAKEFPELSPLMQGEDLAQIQKGLEMAAMLNDADLFGSAGCGIAANEFLSGLLTKEAEKAGLDMDFSSDAARKYFLENIVGTKGFGSKAGDVGFNGNFHALLDATIKRMDLDQQREGFQQLLASKFPLPMELTQT